MTDQAVIAIVAAVPPTLMALAALVSSMRNAVKLDANIGKLEEVHEATNGMKDQLVAQATDAGNAAGRAELKAEQASGEGKPK